VCDLETSRIGAPYIYIYIYIYTYDISSLRVNDLTEDIPLYSQNLQKRPLSSEQNQLCLFFIQTWPYSSVDKRASSG